MTRNEGSILDRHPQIWLLGFLGFLSVLGFEAFTAHNPVLLFWFGFAGFFSWFRFLYEPMKYVGWLGVFVATPKQARPFCRF
ncbi:MAG: hypothetical protein ABEJ27_06885 [Halodesulfurarchaeum sp.]